MLTRGAAGPPDVPIPTRLVTSGPLLLSLLYTHKHIRSHGLPEQTIHRTNHQRKAAAFGLLHRITAVRLLFKGSLSEECVIQYLASTIKRALQ